jgi:general secretion pathway protein L
LAKLRQALFWFIDGLTQAVSDIEDRVRARVPLRLVDVGGGAYALEGTDGVRERELVRADTKGLQPPAFAQAVEGRDIDIVLPPDELLVRTLDPLPPESRQYLDGIVRHQLERVVPWRADNVLFTYKTAPVGAGDNRLLVTVAATARNLHAPLFAALANLSPRRIRLLYPAVERAGGDVAIPLEQAGTGGQHRERLRLGVMGALGALVLVAVGGLAWLMFTDARTSSALEATQTEVDDLRKKLTARGPQNPTGDREAQAILARKRAQPAVVLALDKLAEALPDDTWLTEFSINPEGQLRITGTSQNVADLVPQIEAASVFSDATFFSPTTRLPSGEGDRFHLQMKLKNGGAAK